MDIQNSAEHSQIEQLASETALKMSQAFADLPPTYKRWATFDDFVLVFANMKVATDYSFLGDTYSADEFEAFKDVLAGQGLKVTNPHLSHTASNDPYRQGYVYNPRLLHQETADSSLVLPFNPDEALEAWMERCKQHGIPDGAVYGKLYSFPESAIKDYLARHRNPQLIAALEKIGLRRRASYHTGGETYGFFLPPQADVTQREAAKTALFQALEKNPTYMSLITSPELKQSDILWTARLPEWTRGSNQSSA